MEAAQILDRVVARFIGTKHERDIKKLQPIIAAINAQEPEVQALSDEQLKERFQALRTQVQEQLKDADPAEPSYKEELQKALGPVIVPAFALVREAGRRFLRMRHFDVQLIGGMVLHDGKIAEMKTGEGKTLVATLPAALNALAGRGVHLVTVNDYLARRDAEWMSPLYKALGLTVGVIVHDLDDEQRRAAYAADLTYGTNNEFGFDYLRDNMKYDLASCVQRGHQFAIVDEVDSILIDEARTPLIISGPSEESTDKYFKIDKIIPKLIKDIDYTLDEKHRTATLTEEGFNKCERLLGITNLSDLANIELMHHVYQALRAHSLYKLDVDYVVKDGEVIIVDEFTGRQMPGRRWSDGLHQAVEAKEGVKIERENQTLATITFQNYFRMYKKLSGMTGTAETEAAEFGKIYNLDVVVVPTNRTLIRIENPRRGVPHGKREIRSGGERHPAGRQFLGKRHSPVSRTRTARAGGHHFHRKIGNDCGALEKIGHSASSAQRQAARARIADRRAGWPQRRRNGIDEHGRPRHGHFARRQSRSHDARVFPEEQVGVAIRGGSRRNWSRDRRRSRTTHRADGPLSARRKNLSSAAGPVEANVRAVRAAVQSRARRSRGSRRLAHPGHGAPRGTPH